MKTIIAGSRSITDYQRVLKAILQAESQAGIVPSEVVCGCAPGVDSLGASWAVRNKKPLRRFPASWSEFGKSAGPMRNRQMAEYADALILVHDGTPGSLNMLAEAKKRGLRIWESR